MYLQLLSCVCISAAYVIEGKEKLVTTREYIADPRLHPIGADKVGRTAPSIHCSHPLLDRVEATWRGASTPRCPVCVLTLDSVSWFIIFIIRDHWFFSHHHTWARSEMAFPSFKKFPRACLSSISSIFNNSTNLLLPAVPTGCWTGTPVWPTGDFTVHHGSIHTSHWFHCS